MSPSGSCAEFIRSTGCRRHFRTQSPRSSSISGWPAHAESVWTPGRFDARMAMLYWFRAVDQQTRMSSIVSVLSRCLRPSATYTRFKSIWRVTYVDGVADRWRLTSKLGPTEAASFTRATNIVATRAATRPDHAHLDPNDHRYDNKIKKGGPGIAPRPPFDFLSGGGDNDEPPDAMGGPVAIDALRAINDPPDPGNTYISTISYCS